MPMTNYTRKKFTDHILGRITFARPTTVYLALFTGDPTVAGSFATEVTGGAYARQAVTAAMTDADASGLSSNGVAVAFPQATAYWGPIAFWGLVDALTGGNLLDYIPCTPVREVQSGDTYQVNIGTLTMQHF